MSAIANRFLKYQKDFGPETIIQQSTHTQRMTSVAPVGYRKILLPLRRPRCPSTLGRPCISVADQSITVTRTAADFGKKLSLSVSDIKTTNSGATVFEATNVYHDALSKYDQYTKHFDDVQKLLNPLMSDTSSDLYRFELQKCANLIVNSISPGSKTIIIEKYQKLTNLLAGRPVDGGKIAPYSHKLGIVYIKDILAKKFLRQGEIATLSQVTSLASVLINLWLEYPDFGHVVLSYFYKYCPYLAPVFLSQRELQPDDDYYRSLGYHVTDDVVENHDAFLSRMGGIMRFYAALLIVKPKNDKPNPLGLNEALRWLEVFLNLKPQPDLCALLILEHLQMVGSELLISYNRQMKQLLDFLANTYVPKLKQISNNNHVAYIARLENCVSSFIEKSKYSN